VGAGRRHHHSDAVTCAIRDGQRYCRRANEKTAIRNTVGFSGERNRIEPTHDRASAKRPVGPHQIAETAKNDGSAGAKSEGYKRATSLRPQRTYGIRSNLPILLVMLPETKNEIVDVDLLRPVVAPGPSWSPRIRTARARHHRRRVRRREPSPWPRDWPAVRRRDETDRFFSSQSCEC
jgi:hypothetical protein